MNVFIDGKRVRVDPSKSIGKGGEADIYRLSNKALKLFKQPNHSDFLTTEQKDAARRRIKEHQKKLKVFPKNLPKQVIGPKHLATDQSGKKILGYTMDLIDGAEVLLRYSDKSFRQAIDSNDVVDLFRKIADVVDAIHSASVVLGDFNDLNVLVLNNEPYFIDADSFQYGGFLCKVFTERFADPLLCDPKATRPMLVKPHNEDSDWFSFEVMLMQSLLYVDPYGGVYKPKNKAKRIPHTARSLNRITVFDPEVKYPKPAMPYDVLPDDLLHHFQLVFKQDERGKFPVGLLANLRWTTCTDCGMTHARALCPSCKAAAPAAIKEVTTYRGNVTSTRIFQTKGKIIFAAYQGGKMRYLCHDGSGYLREDGSISVGKLDAQSRYRIRGGDTLFGKTKKPLFVVHPDQKVDQITVDHFGSLPVFDANRSKVFWVQDGVLYRTGTLGPERIGDVLAGQTLFWAGEKFGFGFYRAGTLSVCFVFDVDGKLNDTVAYRVQGQLIDSTCFFAKDRCWFFTSVRDGARTINRCAVIGRNGAVEATIEGEAGDGSWLSQIRGKCAVGKILFVATDDGLIRMDVENGAIAQSTEFPDTEPFVDSGCHLFAGDNGIYIVDDHEIRLLRIG